MLRKSTITTLLLVLAFSALTTNILLVQADVGGTGKFLTVGIVGEGYVNATKASSGEYWEFFDNGTEKVGAGTILLEAFADESWNFSCWTGDLTGDLNPTEYKTQKYGSVTAIFVKQTHTITATAIGPGTINGTKSLTVEVEHGGTSPTFVFAPDDELLYHISLIKVDNISIRYTTSYAFPDPITSDHDIVVTFEDMGIATVPAENDVWLFVDSIAGVFYNATDGGTVIGLPLDFPEGTSVILYDMTTDANDTADGWVLIAMQFDGQAPETVLRAGSADALYSDVDNDGDVDGTDVSLVAIAVKSTTPGGEYFAEYDVNRDDVVNEDDVLTVNENKGATLTALEFWIEGNTLYILNNEWCCFRGR